MLNETLYAVLAPTLLQVTLEPASDPINLLNILIIQTIPVPVIIPSTHTFISQVQIASNNTPSLRRFRVWTLHEERITGAHIAASDRILHVSRLERVKTRLIFDDEGFGWQFGVLVAAHGEAVDDVLVEVRRLVNVCAIAVVDGGEGDVLRFLWSRTHVRRALAGNAKFVHRVGIEVQDASTTIGHDCSPSLFDLI
jgi:hypothetical protein